MLKGKKIYNYDSNFQVIDYNQSHSTLLLRGESKKDSNYRNIDIVFLDVAYVQMPFFFKKINIYTGKNKELNYLLDEGKNIFILSDGESVFNIVAYKMEIYENDLEFDESSIRFKPQSYNQIYPSSV